MKNKEKSISEELNEISPFLGKLRQEDKEFIVPEQYFDRFQNELMEKVLDHKRTTPYKTESSANSIIDFLVAQLQWLLHPKPAMGLALCTVLIIGFLVYTPDNQQNELALENMDTEEIQEYIFDNIESFDESIIIAQSDDWISVSQQDESIEEIYDDILEHTDISDLEELL